MPEAFPEPIQAQPNGDAVPAQKFETEITVNGVSEDDLKTYEARLKERDPELFAEIQESAPAPAPKDEGVETPPAPDGEDGKQKSPEAPPKGAAKAEEEEKLLDEQGLLKEDGEPGATAQADDSQGKAGVPYARFAKVVSDLKNRDAEITQLRQQAAQVQQAQQQLQGKYDLSRVTADAKDAQGNPIFKDAGEFHTWLARAVQHNNQVDAIQAKQQAIQETESRLIVNSCNQQLEAYAETRPRIMDAYNYVDKNVSRVSNEVKNALLRDPQFAPLIWVLATKKGAIESLEGDPVRGIMALGELKAYLHTTAASKPATVTVKESPSARPVEKPAETVVPRAVRGGGTSVPMPTGSSYQHLRRKGYTPDQIARGEYRRGQ